MSTIDAPGRRYRIAELGRLTGFSPSALRFYEKAGVLGAPVRTGAGYRVYDDRDVERLRLLARAKELGCTLEEVAGLVQAWDADQCGPVKHRLRGLVDAKIADVERHLAEQRAFAAQLRATAATLADLPLDGPCADGCGCVGSATAEDPARPIACSLDAAGMDDRIEAWRSLLDDVAARTAIEGGLRLAFAPGTPLADVAGLVLEEQRCCPFLSFAITVDGRGTALEVTAPADGHELLVAVFGGGA